jgi:hypothetical protein
MKSGMGVGRSLVLVVLVSTLVLVACGDGAHPGERIEGNALQLFVEPDKGVAPDAAVYRGPRKELRGNPYIVIRAGVTNVSGQNVYVGPCEAVAFDDRDHRLFAIDPGFTGWVLQAGPLGKAASKKPRFVAPDSVSLPEVRAAVRYEVSCAAYEWIGRLPNYDYVVD